MSENDAVLSEVRERVLLITLNRPEQMNAINTDVVQGLVGAMRRLDQDADLSVGILTGAGPGFCSGMDLKAFAVAGAPRGLGDLFEHGARKPLIAAVEGFALAGGLELALTCDLLVCARDARLGIPEARVGLFAGGGALIRLPGRVGYAKAMEMALTARPIAAPEAHELGLVTRITERGKAIDGAMELAFEITQNAPLAIVASKQIIRSTQGMTETEAWEYQRPLYAPLLRSDDAKEGPRAFAEKRAPKWSGH